MIKSIKNGINSLKHNMYFAIFVIIFMILLGLFFITLDVVAGTLFILFIVLGYSALTPIIRSNFKDVNDKEWKIYISNACIDLPLWINTFIAFTKLTNKLNNPDDQVAISVIFIIILFLAKYAIQMLFDLVNFEEKSKKDNNTNAA